MASVPPFNRFAIVCTYVDEDAGAAGRTAEPGCRRGHAAEESDVASSACNKPVSKVPKTYCARYVSTSWKEGERSGGDSVRDWVMVAGVVSRGL